MDSKIKSVEKNIKQYINFFAPYEVKNRGLKLFENNAVTLQEYDETTDTWRFVVKGTQNYRVKIKNTQSITLDSSCDCPYEWGSVCKHRVAALYYIIDTLTTGKKIEKRTASVKTNKRFGTRNGYLVDQYKSITNKFIKENTSERTFSEIKYGRKRAYVIYNQVEIKKDEVNFRASNELYDVTFFREENQIYITSPYANNSQNLISQEVICLTKIANSPMPDVLNIFFSGKIISDQDAFLASYGLPPTTEFNKYFHYTFNEVSGLVYLSQNKGLVPLKSEDSYYLNLINKLNTKDADFAELIKKETREIGFVLAKDLNTSDYDDDYGYDGVYNNFEKSEGFDEDQLEIEPIIAKTNKAGTLFASHVRTYNAAAEKNFNVKKTDEVKALLKLIERVNDLDYANYEEYFKLKKKMFGLLAKQKFVFGLKENRKGIKKNNLTAIDISDKAIDLQFKVTKSSGFLHCTKCFELGGETIKMNKVDDRKSDSNLLFVDGKYHLVKNPKTAEYLAQIPEKLKMVHTAHHEFYQNIIEPISQNFPITYGPGTFKNERVELDFNKKQIFLSEKNEHIIFTPQVEYDNNVSVILTTTGNILSKNEKTITEYVRNFEMEDEFFEQISAIHPYFEEQKTKGFFYLHYHDFTENLWFYKFFDYLQANNIELYGLKDLKSFKYSPHKGNISTSVSSEQDWFDVTIDARFGNMQIGLADLKKAITNKQKYIQLKDGSVGILPSDWMHKLEKYFRNGDVKKDKLEISKLRFSIVDELFDNIDNQGLFEEIAAKQKRLSGFTEINKTTVPPQIKAKLRPYQKEGLNWLNFLDEMQWGGILADDMGLGKTLQILAFLQQQVNKKKSTNLIVVPTTLLFNWKNEIQKFAPKLKALYYYGIDRIKDTAPFNDYHLVFTTYGILLRDIELLSQFTFNYAILDESQAIKNPVSRRFKAANLIRAKNRIALTGTPIENSTFDLFAQMNFANRGFFGGANAFKENYSTPIDKNGDANIASELQRIVNPFVLRRTKEKVAAELPTKTEDVIYCEMEPRQRKVYDAYRNQYRSQLLNNIKDEGINKSKMMVLEALTRLRQICDSPALLNADDVSETESVKTKEICRHITNKTGKHKILVFSQFVGMLSIIKTELSRLNIDFEYLDGKSSSKQREQSVNNFQNNNDLRVFLISLKAGGTGLNLTAADYVYIVDPWWNPAVENQAIDRCYRIGQDKKVFAYRMICTNTIEEKIVRLQDKKKKLAGEIIHTDENMMKKLDVDDIKELFS